MNNAQTVSGLYTGSRACPSISAVKNAIRITRVAALELEELALDRELPQGFVATFNRAVLYLLWHQFYAVATRGIQLPYIALAEISKVSGLATLIDKDQGFGHKTRLVWMPPNLLNHMKCAEDLIVQVREQLRIRRSPKTAPTFFLSDDRMPLEITPKLIEDLTKDFFPFPVNTQRRIMCRMLQRKGLPSEMVEVYLGHWRERQEPWGQWSSFDHRFYLQNLKDTVPKVLDELGFASPPLKKKGFRK
jgi:hypothetical protein